MPVDPVRRRRPCAQVEKHGRWVATSVAQELRLLEGQDERLGPIQGCSWDQWWNSSFRGNTRGQRAPGVKRVVICGFVTNDQDRPLPGECILLPPLP